MTNQRVQPHGVASSSIDEQEVDLFGYLRVVWRHRWMILALSAAATLLVGGVVYMGPRYYEASVTIVPPLEILEKESSVGGLGAMGNSMLQGVMNTGSISGIYREILESREVADSIIDRFRLMETDEGMRLRATARGRLKNDTKIDTTKEGTVTIAVADLDPNRAAAIASAYVEELDRQNKRLSAGHATSKRIFLENRLKEIEQKFSRIETIPAHEAQVQEMLYEMLTRECELAKIEEARSMPTIQILDEAEVPELPLGRGTINKGMMAGLAAMMFGMLLALALEYRAEMKQAGLARQFQRATRWRKVPKDDRVDQSGDNGAERRTAEARTPAAQP